MKVVKVGLHTVKAWTFSTAGAAVAIFAARDRLHPACCKDMLDIDATSAFKGFLAVKSFVLSRVEFFPEDFFGFTVVFEFVLIGIGRKSIG